MISIPKLLLTAFAGLLLAHCLSAQDAAAWKKEYWIITQHSGFPIFQTPEKDSVSLKLNYFIQSSLLNKLISGESSDPFDALDSASTFLNYQVLRNDARILSVRFTMEGCGAYCENYSLTYTFNSSNGELIQIRDVFTREGYKKAKRLIAEKRKKILRETIEHKKTEIEKASADSAVADSSNSAAMILRDQLDLYEECLGWRDSTTVNGNDFSISDSSVWFVEGRCANHAMRAIDELDEFHNEIRIAYHPELLSDYGKYIFGLSEKYSPRPRRFKIYSGDIAAQYPILFFENSTSGNTVYTYCYKKYGQIIELQVQASQGHLNLIETDGQNIEKGKFHLKRTTNGFKGSYFNASGTEMSFNVSELPARY